MTPLGYSRTTPCCHEQRRDDRQPDPRFRLTVHFGHWRTRPPQHHTRSRPTNHAPPGIGVKTKPAMRVDLRSSLDSDPLAAFVHTEPGNEPNQSQSTGPTGLTGPTPTGMTKRLVGSLTRISINVESRLVQRGGPAGAGAGLRGLVASVPDYVRPKVALSSGEPALCHRGRSPRRAMPRRCRRQSRDTGGRRLRSSLRGRGVHRCAVRCPQPGRA